MQVSKFKINDYKNSVADAVRKNGGVKKTARIFDRPECVVECWIRNGYVRSLFDARKLNDRTDVPIEDLMREPE